MDNSFEQSFTEALEQLKRWVASRPLDPKGRIPPSSTLGLLPDLKGVLAALNSRLADGSALADQQRVRGLSAIAEFTLSWQPIQDEEGLALEFDWDDLLRLYNTLSTL